MKNFSVASLLLLTSLAAPPARAAALLAPAQIEAEFRQSVKGLTERLETAGYPTLGALDTRALLPEIDRVSVSVKSQVTHAQPEGGIVWQRESAEWDVTGDGKVTLSGPRWNAMVAEDKPMLALHETLGARGIADDNFGCSGSAWLLAAPPGAPALSPADAAAIARFGANACALAGGSTGVTGGGDDQAVRGKIHALRSGFQRLHQTKTPAARDAALQDIYGLLSVNFEINPVHMPHFYGPGEKHDTYCLPAAADPATVRAYVNEQPIPRSAFAYDPATHCIRFFGKYVPIGDDRPGAMWDPLPTQTR